MMTNFLNKLRSDPMPAIVIGIYGVFLGVYLLLLSSDFSEQDKPRKAMNPPAPVYFWPQEDATPVRKVDENNVDVANGSSTSSDMKTADINYVAGTK